MFVWPFDKGMKTLLHLPIITISYYERKFVMKKIIKTLI